MKPYLIAFLSGLFGLFGIWTQTSGCSDMSQAMNHQPAASSIVVVAEEQTLSDGSTQTVIVGGAIRLVIEIDSAGEPSVLGPDNTYLPISAANAAITGFTGQDLGLDRFKIPAAQMQQVQNSGVDFVQASLRDVFDEDSQSYKPAIIVKKDGQRVGLFFVEASVDVFAAIEDSGILAGTGMPSGLADMIKVGVDGLVGMNTDGDFAVILPSYYTTANQPEIKWPNPSTDLVDAPAAAGPTTCGWTATAGDSVWQITYTLAGTANQGSNEWKYWEAKVKPAAPIMRGEFIPLPCPADEAPTATNVVELNPNAN